MLKKEQTVPQDSLFRNDISKKSCWKIEDRNEARVMQGISVLIVPSAVILATYGATHLDCLIEGVNEGWTGSIAVEGSSRPQPDYSVRFRRSIFTDEQLNKLDPLIGSIMRPHSSSQPTAQSIALNEHEMLSMTHLLRVLFVNNVFAKDLKGPGYEKALKFYT